MQNRKKILVVNDNDTISRVIDIIMEDKFECKWLKTLQDAKEWLLNGNKTEIIITDLRAPKFSGINFIMWMKESENYANIPIVVLCTEIDYEEEIRLLDLGAEDVITKPFNMLELKLKIDNIIGANS